MSHFTDRDAEERAKIRKQVSRRLLQHPHNPTTHLFSVTPHPDGPLLDIRMSILPPTGVNQRLSVHRLRLTWVETI